MFNFKKQTKKKIEVVAPISGECLSIGEVKDDVFAKKMMGDGFAIKPLPESSKVVSPIDGKIVALPDSKHAIGIKSDEHDMDILVHIGLDTVSLKGRGFSPRVKLNQEVKAGQPIMDLDKNVMQKSGLDMTTMVVITDGYKKPIDIGSKKDTPVKVGQPILRQA